MATNLARLHSVFDLAMRTGVGMLTNGAAASEVSATVLRITSASGYRNVAIQVTFDEVMLSYLPDDMSTPFTRVRAAGSRAQDFARLTAFEHVTERYIDGDLALDEANRIVHDIPLGPPLYPFWLTTAGLSVMGGGLAVSFGGGPLVVLAATLGTALLTVTGQYLSRLGVPPFYSQALGGLIGVGSAVLASQIDPSVNSSIVAVSCMIILLAGLASIGAMQDAVTGWYVTASARILETVMLTVGLVIGVRAGIVIAHRVGADVSVSSSLPVSLISVVSVIVSGLVVGLGYGIGVQVPRRLLIVQGPITAMSGLISHLLTGPLGDRLWAVGIAAMAVGMVAVVLARRLRAPALIFIMSGVLPLVPGSRIYRGLLGLGEDVSQGTVELFGAAEIAIAIAAGAVFGQLLASRLLPATSRAAAGFTPVITAPFTTLRRRRGVASSTRRRRSTTAALEPSTMTGEMTALSPEMVERSRDVPEPHRAESEEP